MPDAVQIMDPISAPGTHRFAKIDANGDLQVTGTLFPSSGATSISNSATNAAGANNVSIPAAAGKFSYLSGFAVTGLGATAASTIAVTVTGLTNTLTYYLTIPAGATTAITPLSISFNPPLQSSAVNTAITVNVPSFGAGNTNAANTVWGFQQ